MHWQNLKQQAAEYQLPLATVVAEALHLAILEGLFSRAESRAGFCLSAKAERHRTGVG